MSLTAGILSVMVRLPLQSRAVVSAGYDADARQLEVEFSSGRVYRFSGVPAGVYDWLVRVPNKGLYVARNITGLYDYVDITDPPVDEEPSDLEALLAASLSSASD